MPHVESHKPGNFCWVELGAADLAAAKSFYTTLFGWNAVDMPMGPDSVYTMFRLEGREAAAAYQLDPKQHLGVPPHWTLYICVDNAEDAARRTTEFGGKVVVDPYDVFDAGRMAALQDPTGAHFCVWQPKAQKGIGIAGVPSTLCWSELATPDATRARDFYGQLFGWGMKDSGPNYTELMNAGEAVGGILQMDEGWQGIAPHWSPYFLVADADASAGKARGLGATWKMPPTDLPGVGRFALITDPQGAVLHMIQIAKP